MMVPENPAVLDEMVGEMLQQIAKAMIERNLSMDRALAEWLAAHPVDPVTAKVVETRLIELLAELEREEVEP